MIILHNSSAKHIVPFNPQTLNQQTLQQVVNQLKTFSVVEQEASFYLALMKIIQAMPSKDINDELYEIVKDVLRTEFILFRYYGCQYKDMSSTFPCYNTASLMKLRASRDYLTLWAGRPTQSGIHPASLFANKILRDDFEDRPLRYLSYCQDPFCSLMTLSPFEAGDYIRALITTLDSFVDKLKPDEPITYLGFASGLFGRDALRLDLISRLLKKKNKNPSTINMIMIDSCYTQLVKEIQHVPLELREKTYASLIKKSAADLLNFAKSLLRVDVHLHLFQSLEEARMYMQDNGIHSTFMCAEDFFKDEVESEGLNQAIECRAMLRDMSGEKLKFDAFIAYKDKICNSLCIENTDKGEDKTITFSTPSPYQAINKD